MRSWIAGPAACAAVLLPGLNGPAWAGRASDDDVAGPACRAAVRSHGFEVQGVAFWSVDVPNELRVGQRIGVTHMTPRMMLVSDTNSIGRPNLAFASGSGDAGPNDLLMRFSTPVRYVKVVTDATAEKPDRVRLLALEATGVPNQFVVRAIDVGLDDATPPVDNVLAVSTRRPFSFALFQATAEREGIDSLRFETTCSHAADEHAEPLRPLLRVFPDEQGDGEWRWRPVP